jgi:hypothetical protein
MKVWTVIDVGCQECGVDSVVVGTYLTLDEARAACDVRSEETGGWRDGGQTIAEVFELDIPEQTG